MSSDAPDTRALLQRAFTTIEQMQAKLDASERAQHEPIAIVGMACRFPGAVDTPEAFWTVLSEGVDTITEVPPERWDVDAYYDADPEAPGKTYTRWGGFLKNLDLFDADFFGNAPREAVNMDPQHRLLLETAWESLERAGLAPARVAGSNTGVFVGIGAMDYAYLQMRHGDIADFDAYSGTGTSHSIAAGRLAYALDLSGPTMAVDTACSSSLVALHLACQALRARECDMALGGGVNVTLTPDNTVATSRARMMSFTGRCHTFDAAADGYVRSEGCAMVVLKRLDDALAAGDSILAVIRGTALTQDGRSNGLTAPSRRAQEQVIRGALKDAGVAPDDVSYVEAHGTGTSLGDPIEVLALGEVFAGRPANQPLMIGSVKTNIGHTEAAAGVAGLIKVILALQHGVIPPHLHLRTPNPFIPWGDLPITVPTTSTPWHTAPDKPRVAGLSSFGFSGTNAHMIIEGAPAPRPADTRQSERGSHVLALSARTPTALERLAEQYERRLGAIEPAEFPDLCFTAAAGRSHFGERLALVATSASEAQARLAALRAGNGDGLARGSYHKSDPPAVAFLFTGQGSQYVGMGKALYASEPVFRESVDRCARVLDGLLERPLTAVLFAPSSGGASIDDTLLAQPALFALEWSLAQLWISWGVKPTAVLGHSVGEYVAACIAGVFSLDHALQLIAARGRLMQALPHGGAMASVMAPAERVQAMLGTEARAVIAAYNARDNTVVSGSAAAVATLLQRFAAQNITARPLTVSHAFHSPLMEPMLAEFRTAAGRVVFSPPEIDLMCNRTGARVEEAIASADYWVAHVSDPVQFMPGVLALHQQGYRHYLEIGPAAVLTALVSQCVPGDDCVLVPSMRRNQDDQRCIAQAAADLYARGVDLDWESYDQARNRRKLVLPTYPFERARYWLESYPQGGRQPVRDRSSHPFLGEETRSPRLQGALFQAEIAADEPAFVADHVVFDTVVVPGAAYLETALAGARRVLDGPVCIEEATIREPLALEQGTRTLQTVVERRSADECDIHIYSAEPDSDAWRLHVTAHGRRLPSIAAAPETPEPAPPARTESVDAGAYYAAVEAGGVAYGPRFRLLRDIEVAENFATATIDAPPSSEMDRFAAHPAVIDAAFQVAGAALLNPGKSDGDTIYLPMAAARFEVLGPLSGPLRAITHVHSAPEGQETFLADVRITSAGRTVVRVTGMRFKRATAAALRRAIVGDRDLAYRVDWELLPADVGAAARDRSWWLLSDRAGFAAAVAQQLRDRGERAVVAQLAPADAGRGWSVRALKAQIAAAGSITDVLDCRALDLTDAGDAASCESALRKVCLGLVHLVDALSGVEGSLRLNVATRGAQETSFDSDRVAVGQAAVWGIARTIRNEHPGLACKIIDLPVADADAVAQRALVGELGDTERREWQVALRGSQRLAARLARVDAAEQKERGLSLPHATDFGLEIASRGVLDHLRLEPLTILPPADDEIQIAVQASGLNFRDVLSALGMYPGEPGPLGGEVVGEVLAVGHGVADFRVGDEVMALTPRGFCSRVNTPALLACKRPAGLSMIEAATMPIVFQTAYYALHDIARMKRGERILIHAGAGGVGLAAIQLAQQIGAEIFATAGSDEKRQLLAQLGVQHVMDSRSLDFASQVHAATGGAGIDVVLNSLAGDFIPRSLELLREGGRFIELGKTDLWDQARASAVNRHARYQAFYLGDLCANERDVVRRIFDDLLALMNEGSVRPLPVSTFPVTAAVEAFRYMAQAKHIGKLVIEQPRDDAQPVVRADGSYVVTGGLGGIGLHVARWLAAHGAGRIVLCGRSAPRAAASAAIAQLRAEGHDVVVQLGDVASAADVYAMIEEAQATGLRLRGVLHSAGVLDDGILLQQTDERFARVLAPKVIGGRLLLDAVRHSDLDFLVFFSSAAALFGAVGQGNYAAANSFLDSLAAAARERGIRATSVNWGPWNDTGMTTTLSDRDRERWAEVGMRGLEPDAALAALERHLRGPNAQLVILDINWTRASAMSDSPFVRKLVQGKTTSTRRDEPRAAVAQRDVRGELEGLPADAQREHLSDHVREQVRGVLGLAPTAPIRADRGFVDLGMDSLMSVELSNRLRASLGCVLPTTLTFEYPTLDDVVTKLIAVLGFSASPEQAATPKKQAAAAPPADDARLASMSADEASAALGSELDEIGY